MLNADPAGRFSLLARIGVTLVILRLILCPAVADEAERFDLRIPSGPADIALKALAKETGKSLLFDYRDVEKIRTRPIAGRYSLEEALAEMLDGTGLTAALTQAGVIAVSAAAQSPPPHRTAREKSAPPSSPLPEEDVERRSATGRYGGEVFTIEEVIVTARRYQEDLQSTPVSVSALSQASLERHHIVRTQDLDRIVSNLQFGTMAPLSGNNSASQIFVRGIGQTDPTAGVDPGVGLYVDGVYIGQSVGRAFDVHDVASIQVLRGAQGTLFGRNTIGGAILVETVDPGDAFGGRVQAGIGSDDLRELFIALDLPLGEDVKTRFTWGIRDRDGYVVRASDGLDLGDTHNQTFTFKTVWTPDPATRISLRADYREEDEHGTPLVFAAINEAAAVPRIVSAAAGCPGMAPYPESDGVPPIDDERCANDFWNDGPFVTNGTFPLESRVENWGLSMTVDWTLSEALSLKSITSYRGLQWSGNRDADNTPFRILHTRYRSEGDQFSQEIQGTIRHEGLTGVVGAFYYQEKIDDRLRVSLWHLEPPRATADSNDNLVKNRSWALFTQWSLALTPALQLTGGLRYTSEMKGSKPDQFSYDAPDTPYVPRRFFKRQFDAITGSGALQFQWNDAVMTYASWSQGFKGGGFNSRFNNVIPSGEPPAFDEEKAETIELGLKSTPLDNLRLNGAWFSTDYDNLQFTYRIGFAPFLFNAGKASIDGFEGKFQFVPFPNLIVNGGIGYLNARITEVAEIPGATTSVTTESRLPYTPKWQANLGAAYSFRAFAGISLTPRLSLSFTGRQFFDAGNTPEISQTTGVTVVNASIVVERPRAGWRIVLGVDNLTDEIYPVAGNSSLTTDSGYAEIAYARPREWFLRLSKSF